MLLNNIVDATLVGDEATINNVCKELGFDVSKLKIVQEADEKKQALRQLLLLMKAKAIY